MKKFKGNKHFEEIEKQLLDCGFKPDYTEWNKGGDWRFFNTGLIADHAIDCIYYGVFGYFAVECNGKIVATESSDMDGTLWYDELLNILYEPIPVKSEVR